MSVWNITGDAPLHAVFFFVVVFALFAVQILIEPFSCPVAKVASFKTLTHVGADEHAESDDHDGFISSSEDEDDEDAFICHTFTFLSRPTVMKRLSFKNAKSYISPRVRFKSVR